MLGINHIRTTSNHPQSNGMVERFHRQLKQSIRATNSTNWTEHLPLILLGIRTTLKEDLQRTPCEMLYGENPKIPEEFFSPSSPDRPVDPSNFADQLRQNFENLRPTPTRTGTTQSTYTPKNLNDCTSVFVRVDRVKTALKSPYEGPFIVLHRLRKYFIIDKNGTSSKISIDRLKPAFVGAGVVRFSNEVTVIS